MMNSVLVGVLLVLAVVVMVFLILREFWTWYWKQSEQVALLRSIDARLAKLNGEPAPGAPARAGWERVLDPRPGTP